MSDTEEEEKQLKQKIIQDLKFFDDDKNNKKVNKKWNKSALKEDKINRIDHIWSIIENIFMKQSNKNKVK